MTKTYQEYQQIAAHLRAIGRTELVHYAGAAHRDPIAAAMIEAHLADPDMDDRTLKRRVLSK